MKALTLLSLLVFVSLTACKQEVGFSSMDSVEREEPLEVKGPKVKIIKAPQDQMIGEESEVIFEVLKGDNEIEEVICSLDQHQLPCDWLKGILKILPLSLGQHLFEVSAIDVEGLKDKAQEDWNVFNRFRRIKDKVEVKASQKSMDILFVIDNSSSMRDEQTKISQRFSHFIDQVKNLDWNIALTTTNPQKNQKGSDGQFDPFDKEHLFLKSSMNHKQAQDLFAKHVKRKESGWDTEMGIRATYRAIERTINPKVQLDKDQAEFFRNESALAVVVVSDEDESGTSVKSLGSELLKLVDSQWGSQKRFQFNSIIVNSQACLNGGGHTMGVKYEELSRKTNGIVGDVCSNNYSDILKSLGESVSNLQKIYNLKCVPQDMNQDGKIDLVIRPKGPFPIPGYTIDKNQIQFDQPLIAGQYEFHYFCLDNK